jgi:HAD superfamily hydrolase (TIGR01509 family)
MTSRPDGPVRRLAAVVFDMDGTLTRPLLDFDAIAAEIGISREVPILEAMAAMPPAERAAAEAVVVRHERAAAETGELNPGAAELLAHLRRRGLPIGLLTRNCRECVDILVGRFALPIDSVVSREDAAPKPAPDGVLLNARRFGVDPAEMLMVGDYLFDLRAGRAAGSRTALLTNGRDWAFAHEADYVLHELTEGIALVETLLAGG